jgi:hypothetical protein
MEAAAGKTPDGGEPIGVRAIPLKAYQGTRLGRSQITVEAVFALRSSEPAFGGLSGLWLGPDAGRMIAVNDEGRLFITSLIHDERGILTDIVDWSVMDTPRRLDDPGGRRAFDAEALTSDGTGGLVVAYEGHHRLRRLSLADLHASPDRLPLPSGLGGPSNSGMEALATLEDGRLLAIAERVGAWGGVGLSAWLVDHAGEAVQDLVYVPSPNFAPTGADRLGDTLYVIERQFSMLSGIRSRIVAVPTADIRPGAHLEGEVLATFRWGDLGQNFEAIAAKSAPDNRTLLYLLSDDNFSFFQETLLLQLSLKPAPNNDVVN